MRKKPVAARHQVREEIQRRILAGESQPGERLTQQSLAKELGVAQGTVRESLFELQWLGLVDSVDRLGVFVGKLDGPALVEAYLVREILEGLAARLACSHAARADIADLRRAADYIFQLSQEGRDRERGKEDRNFHLRIMNLSRNKILMRLASSYRVLGMAVQAWRDPEVVHFEHLQIVDAIEKNLPDDAERFARRHVELARKKIELLASNGNFTPKWVLD